jgi:hypothetical protein
VLTTIIDQPWAGTTSVGGVGRLLSWRLNESPVIGVAVSRILNEDWIVRAVSAIVLLSSVPTIWAKGFFVIPNFLRGISKS